MRLGILPLPVLLSLFGILQLPSRWGQGKQFYCRRVYEPELRLGGESVVYRIWGPPRKGPARVCTAPRPAAQSSPAARPGGLFLRFLSTPPHPVEIPLPERLPAPDPPRTRPGWGVGAQEEGHSRLGPSAGGGSEAGGPDREPRWGPGSCGAERGGRRDRHSPAGHELGIRAPDTPDTLQHRRHPRPAHGSPRTLCVAASRVEPRSHVAAVRAGGAD